MKTIYIRGGDKTSKGVKYLTQHLEAKGHEVVRSKDKPHDRIFCWGVSTRELGNPKPAVNGEVNKYNKRTAINLFAKANLNVPALLGPNTALTNRRLFAQTKPWFGRKLQHEKGNDIVVCQEWNEVIANVEGKVSEYFSVYVPHDLELRAWVFNGKVLAIYHKQYRNPGLMNFRNLEVRSELRDDLLQDEGLTAAATEAVRVLKMDWGAVDILMDKDGEPVVLEVNSMPDISSPERISGIRLAKAVSEWAEK